MRREKGGTGTWGWDGEMPTGDVDGKMEGSRKKAHRSKNRTSIDNSIRVF